MRSATEIVKNLVCLSLATTSNSLNFTLSLASSADPWPSDAGSSGARIPLATWY
jgi:hypothetical protein